MHAGCGSLCLSRSRLSLSRHEKRGCAWIVTLVSIWCAFLLLFVCELCIFPNLAQSPRPHNNSSFCLLACFVHCSQITLLPSIQSSPLFLCASFCHHGSKGQVQRVRPDRWHTQVSLFIVILVALFDCFSFCTERGKPSKCVRCFPWFHPSSHLHLAAHRQVLHKLRQAK